MTVTFGAAAAGPTFHKFPGRLSVLVVPLVFPGSLTRQFPPEPSEPPASLRPLVRFVAARSARAVLARPEVVIPQFCLMPFEGVDLVS